MKIEMGESLFYSWLRHVKECQIAQTNWKPSPSWRLHDEERLQRFMDISGEFFQRECGYGIFKNNSLSQWFEVPANNDRPLLLAWLDNHGQDTESKKIAYAIE